MFQWRKLLVCLSSVLVTSAMASNKANDLKLDAFISGLDAKCAYTDGYQCHQSDPSFYSQQSQQALVPAAYLSAWAVTSAAFAELSDLTEAQKDLRHYKIGFAEQDDQIVVLFSAIFLPYLEGDKAEGVSTGVFGQSIKFWVDKETMAITKKLYLK